MSGTENAGQHGLGSVHGIRFDPVAALLNHANGDTHAMPIAYCGVRPDLYRKALVRESRKARARIERVLNSLPEFDVTLDADALPMFVSMAHKGEFYTKSDFPRAKPDRKRQKRS